MQNIVYGTKTLLFSILYCTRHYHSAQQYEATRQAAMAAGQAPPPPPPSPAAVGMPEEDVVTCSHLLTAGLACLKVASYCG